MHDATLEPRCPGWTSFGRSPGDGNDLGIPEGKNPRNWMACFNELPSQGPQEPITASGALLSGGLNTDRPGSEQAWTVRVVWISFRPSEPETWVRILHGPPTNILQRGDTERILCSGGEFRTLIADLQTVAGHDSSVDLSTVPELPFLSFEVYRVKPESHLVTLCPLEVIHQRPMVV